MEKIKLFKKRNFGEVIGTSFDLLRQNFKLISMCFVVIVLPLMTLAIFMASMGLIGTVKQNIAQAASGSKNPAIWNVILFLIGYIGFIITFYFQSAVLHETIIAYENSDDPQQLKVSDVWTFIKADMGRIIGSLFGLIPLWIALGIVAALVYTLFASVSRSAGGLWIFILYLGYIYITVCMGSFLMLRLRSEYGILTSLVKSITMTFGDWRWWRMLGINFIMMLVVFSFYSVSMIPLGILIYIYKIHVVSSMPRDQVLMVYYTIVGIGLSYAAVGLCYCWNLVLLGSTVNYYSLIEENEHIGLQMDIANIGVNEESINFKDGEY
jgi:hypothetical protein